MEDDSFTINEETDTIINKSFPPMNLAQIYFNSLPSSLRRTFDDYFNINSNIKNSLNYFIEGIRYENGLNREVDYKNAYEYFALAAKKNNPHALYKLYCINKNKTENTKYQIQRDKNREMFYLFKALAYSDPKLENQLFNYIKSEISIYSNSDTKFLDKANRLFIDMQPFIDEAESRYVEAIILTSFNQSEEDISLGISVLHDLADCNQYLHAFWKLACFYFKEKNYEMASKYFNILIENFFYESYCDFVEFEIDKNPDSNKIKYCKELLMDALKAGHLKCLGLYFRLYLFDLDINKIFEFYDNNLDSIIINILNRDYFFLVEYFILTNVLIKSNSISNTHKNISRFQNELIQMTKNLLEDLNISAGIMDIIYFNFSNAYVYYYFEKNFEQAEICFKKTFDLIKSSKENSLKFLIRICYYYFYKSRKNKFKFNKEIKVEKLKRTQVKLFKIMNEWENNSSEHFYNDNLDNYLLGRIYEKGIGTEINDLKSFSFYCKLSKSPQLDYSILSIYKIHKAKTQILKEEKYKNILKDLKFYKNSKISTQDENNLCNICFDNFNTILCLPCKHLSCDDCHKIIFKKDKKCPICRNQIISII